MRKKGIDFVITWVDGNDPVWQQEKAKYSPRREADVRTERYRDWELLKYWFRGVEQFAPWVRRIHFVTCGHYPDWLNTEHKKLHLVKHRDYIPERFLPTFNSNVIEMYLHRIKGLSEQFVYFNDDMFVTGPVKPRDFFRGGKPCDMLAFQPVVANPKNPVMSHLFLNEALVLSKYFDKRENVKQQPFHYFHIGYPPLYFFYNFLELAFPLYTSFYTPHGPSPFLKRSFEEVWGREAEELLATSANRFRSKDDQTQYLFREWQKLRGNFCPKNVLRGFCYFNLDDHNEKLKKTLKEGKAKMICINDANEKIDFERVKSDLLKAMEQYFPEKSSFELY